MLKTRLRLTTFMWLLSAVSLSVGDHFFHVRNGILSYHWNPQVDHQSIWAWLIFGAASALIVLLAFLLPTTWLGRSDFRWSGFWLSAAIVYFGYWTSGQLGNTHPWLLTWSVLALWVIRFALASGKPAVLVASLTFGGVGPLAEGVLSGVGLFDYVHVDVVRIPLWLAALYLHLGFVVVEIARGLRAAKP